MSPLETQFLDLGDVRLAYSEYGSGPVLLLLHGNSESKKIFSKYQLEHFQDHHTIAIDSRGHGQSRSSDSQYSIPQFADDIIRFCRAKGISSADVIGYSDGGNIVLLMAKQAPELFPRTVAISPNYLVSGTEEKTLKAFHSLVRVLKFLGRLGFNTKQQLMRMDLMLKDIGITDAELGALRTRMLLLYAQKDMIKEEHILQIGRLVPGTVVQKIEQCTHLSILEKPAAVQAIRSFLSGS